jgi:lysophospholipase L1-like esterase
MTRTVMCFGDSNTHGTMALTRPLDRRRFPRDMRWPGVFAADLGAGWHVIEEGLPSRTTVHDDPVEGLHKNGRSVLPALLDSHRPLDLVIVMLGTNDLKQRFNVSAEEVGTGIERLLKVVQQSECLTGGMDRVIVVAPPPVIVTGIFMTMFAGAEPKSHGLAEQIGDAARAAGAHFLNAGDVVVSSPVDGIHLDGAEQVKLGNAVADALLEIADAP